MKLLKIVFCVTLLFNSFFTNAQENKFTLSGTITDKSSNETLIGVNIIIPKLKTGVIANEYGFYSITLPKGTYNVVISYVGYGTKTMAITLDKNVKQNIQLEESAEGLDEVVITKKVDELDIKKPQMSVNALSSETIKSLPAVLGEVDVIKAITLLPGVTSAGEGAAGFNVRGGAADQNLVLLDEASIFNSSHLFGFFSVFNPDAIKNLKLYKGGIPARYGGRASSVLDIYQKEGNSNRFSANGGIGLVSSRLLLEGPLKKEKSSFLIGGRGTYAHLFFPLFNLENTAYFYDLNTKISFKLNENNNLFLSGYFGRDIFSINDSFKNQYGNGVGILRWNHLFSDKLFSNLSFIYSDYYYGLNLDLVEFQWDSGIINYNFKYDLKHYLSDTFKMQYGINSIYYEFNPGEIKPSTPNSGINYEQLTKKYALENAIYFEAEHKWSNRLTASYGIRFSYFNRLGQDSLNTYKNNTAVEYNKKLQIYQRVDPTGTETFKRSDVIKSFVNPEPRFALSYQLQDNSSLKLSYNRMSQYLHLLSNTNSPTPLDIWTPSGKYIKPQISDQVAAGYFVDFNDNEYTLEVENFYKFTQNRIDYIDGANLIANNTIEQVILRGKAKAYGMEFLLRKNRGKLKGWVAYTLSESLQKTKPVTMDGPGINNGKWYSTPFDKTHDLSIVSTLQLGKKWTFNVNFIAQTGQPVTFPSGQYTYNNTTVPSYFERNKNRLPTYHRLDASFNWTPNITKNKGYKGELVIGCYNVYNRRNASSISFRRKADTNSNEALKLSIFGIVPSLAYNFKF